MYLLTFASVLGLLRSVCGDLSRILTQMAAPRSIIMSLPAGGEIHPPSHQPSLVSAAHCLRHARSDVAGQRALTNSSRMVQVVTSHPAHLAPHIHVRTYCCAASKRIELEPCSGRVADEGEHHNCRSCSPSQVVRAGDRSQALRLGGWLRLFWWARREEYRASSVASR